MPSTRCDGNQNYLIWYNFQSQIDNCSLTHHERKKFPENIWKKTFPSILTCVTYVLSKHLRLFVLLLLFFFNVFVIKENNSYLIIMTNRFTIVNENRDQILLSPSLKEKIAKKQQQQNANKNENLNNSRSAESSTKSSNAVFTESGTDSYSSIYPELPSFDSSPTPQQIQEKYQLSAPDVPSQSSQYLNFNSGFDPSFLLLELRNEYERKLQQYQMLWRKNLEDMDRLNKDLLKKNKELFSNEMKRIDNVMLKKHFNTPSAVGNVRVQPCKEVEDKLIRCFELNEKKSLLCGNLIREFADCVDKARLETLKEKK